MAEETKYFVSEENLQEYHGEAKKAFVAQREGYGLSKNDLTDELKAKILAAGDSTFSGDYDDLENKPAIDGTELDASSTAAGLGLAKAEDIPGVATAEKAGTVKPDGTTITAKADGTISAVQPDVSGFVPRTEIERDFAKKTDLPDEATSTKAGLVKPDNTTITVDNGVISAELDDYAKTAEVEGMLEEYVTEEDLDTKLDDYVEESDLTSTLGSYVTTNAMNSAIESAISDVKEENQGAIHTRGNIAFASLPQPTQDIWGDMYNVTDAFVTNANFQEGTGQDFPANTEVYVIKNGDNDYKWAIYHGYIDMSKYALKADAPQPMPSENIKALFS